MKILFRPEIQWKIETGFAFLILEVFRSKGCLVRCGIQDNTMSCSNQHRQRGLHIRNIIFGSSYITIYKLRVVLTRIKNIHYSRITPLSSAKVHFINKKWIFSAIFVSTSKYPLFWKISLYGDFEKMQKYPLLCNNSKNIHFPQKKKMCF